MDGTLKEIAGRQEYKEGFVTEIGEDRIPKGLSEDIIRMISARKQEPQWLLDFRLDAFRKWKKMKEPSWGHLVLPKIDYDNITYWSAPSGMRTGPTRSIPPLWKPSTSSGSRCVRGRPWPV